MHTGRKKRKVILCWKKARFVHFM